MEEFVSSSEPVVEKPELAKKEVEELLPQNVLLLENLSKESVAKTETKATENALEKIAMQSTQAPLSSYDETLQKESKIGELKQEQTAKVTIDTDNTSLAVENITTNESSSPKVINFDKSIQEHVAQISQSEGHPVANMKEQTELESIGDTLKLQETATPASAIQRMEAVRGHLSIEETKLQEESVHSNEALQSSKTATMKDTTSETTLVAEGSSLVPMEKEEEKFYKLDDTVDIASKTIGDMKRCVIVKSVEDESNVEEIMNDSIPKERKASQQESLNISVTAETREIKPLEPLEANIPALKHTERRATANIQLQRESVMVESIMKDESTEKRSFEEVLSQKAIERQEPFQSSTASETSTMCLESIIPEKRLTSNQTKVVTDESKISSSSSELVKEQLPGMCSSNASEMKTTSLESLQELETVPDLEKDKADSVSILHIENATVVKKAIQTMAENFKPGTTVSEMMLLLNEEQLDIIKRPESQVALLSMAKRIGNPTTVQETILGEISDQAETTETFGSRALILAMESPIESTNKEEILTHFQDKDLDVTKAKATVCTIVNMALEGIDAQAQESAKTTKNEAKVLKKAIKSLVDETMEGKTVKEIISVRQPKDIKNMQCIESQMAMLSVVDKLGHSNVTKEVVLEQMSEDRIGMLNVVGTKALASVLQENSYNANEVMQLFSTEDFQPVKVKQAVAKVLNMAQEFNQAQVRGRTKPCKNKLNN